MARDAVPNQQMLGTASPPEICAVLRNGMSIIFIVTAITAAVVSALVAVLDMQFLNTGYVAIGAVETSLATIQKQIDVPKEATAECTNRSSKPATGGTESSNHSGS